MARSRHNAGLSYGEQLGDLRADYSAAKLNRFRRTRTGLAPLGSNADYHYRLQGDYFRMMEYARDMDRGDMVVGQMIDRACTNTIQDGLRVDPLVPDAAVAADLKARFEDWAEDAEQCDLGGQLTFWEMQWLALRHVLVDGDILALPTRDGPVELVEGHRLRTPQNTQKNVIHGVELDERTRRRIRYWLTVNDVPATANVERVADIKKYPAYDEEGNKQVLQVYSPKRVSQTRGVTALAPIFDAAGMLDDIQFATLVQRQAVACFAIFRERELGFDMPEASTQVGPRTPRAAGDGTPQMLEGMSPGMHVTGLPGERLKMDSPNVPNPEYFPHVRLILTFIGCNVGMPLVLVLMDASETNFSGFRGAVDQARMGFRHNQRVIRFRLCQPIFQWKARQFCIDDAPLRRAAERFGRDFFKARWNAPSWPYLQPLQDAGADLMRRRNGLTSGRRWATERGMDYATLTDEIVEDNASLIRKAQQRAEQLNQEFPGIAVTWRELAGLPTPDGVSLRVDAAGDQPAALTSVQK